MTDVTTTLNSITVTDAGSTVTVDIGTWPAAHATTHGAGGYDPITSLGTVAVTSASITAGTITTGTVTTLTAGTATFTGATIGAVSNAELQYLDGVTSAVQTQLNAKAPTASPTFTGQVSVPLGSESAPSIVPGTDTNTGIYSPGADQVALSTAGTARVYVGSGGDVGIGTTSPVSRLHVAQSGQPIYPVFDGVGSSAGAYVLGRQARGTLSSPTATQSGDTLAAYGGRGYGATGFGGSTVGAVGFLAEENFTDSAQGTRFVVNTTPTGSTTPTERMRIDNAGLITGTGTSLGAWTAFTPTWTNLTIGNGTQSAAYCRIGKTVFYRINLTFGSTTSISGFARFALPVSMVASDATSNSVALLIDASTGVEYAAFFLLANSNAYLKCFNGTDGTTQQSSATVPFTWTTSDQIRVTGHYESA